MNKVRGFAKSLFNDFPDEANLNKYSNTWGDAIVVGFKSPNSGIEFSIGLLEILNLRGIQARIGMAIGELSLVHNPILEKIAPEGPAMNEGARLEPLAGTGEILISSALRGENLDENRFKFQKVEKKLKKDVGEFKAGETLICYSVSRKIVE